MTAQNMLTRILIELCAFILSDTLPAPDLSEYLAQILFQETEWWYVVDLGLYCVLLEICGREVYSGSGSILSW